MLLWDLSNVKFISGSKKLMILSIASLSAVNDWGCGLKITLYPASKTNLIKCAPYLLTNDFSPHDGAINILFLTF